MEEKTVVTLELTSIELSIAKMVGMERYNESVAQRLTNSYGSSLDPKVRIQRDISGASGEMAAAKAFGLYWPAGVNTYHSPDFGQNVQIRTGSEDFHSLIVRSNDSSNEIYIFVIDHAPKFSLMGWMFGHEAKKDCYLRAAAKRPASWFVPQLDLHDIVDATRRILRVTYVPKVKLGVVSS